MRTRVNGTMNMNVGSDSRSGTGIWHVRYKSKSCDGLLVDVVVVSNDTAVKLSTDQHVGCLVE
jgi:hypothetical protein